LIHREGGAQLAATAVMHADRARAAVDCRVLLLDDLPRRARSTADSGPGPESPAMVNFTSGSTGTPKGVLRDHATLVRAAFTTAQSNLIEAHDVVAFTGSFSFIGAYARSLGALVAGAELCIRDQRAGGGRELAAWILDRRISVLQFIPSVLRNFTEAASRARVPRMDAVKIVSIGGETTYGRDVARARTLFGADTRFVNRYGSSETSVLAEWLATTDDDARADEPLPLGHPLPWAEIVVVDDVGEPVVAGEVGGPEVVSEHCSLGYWNDPELTREKFWVLADGRRGFRMTDHVRVRDDGVLEYVSRTDDRVKVRGVMVSPSEVERALTALASVSDAAVVPAPARDGGTRLVGYVVPDPDTGLSTWEVRRELASVLPNPMVPGTVVPLESLPLNPRGKVDRSALPPPPDPEPRPYREPVGRAAVLASIFTDVLGVDRVGLDDDFFELGGDSLGVVELVAEIADRFSVDVPTSTVVEAPTVAELSARLSHRRHRGASPVVVLRSETADPTLFCVTGGGAPAVTLRELSVALAGRNFAAIQSRGLEERAFPDHRVVAAARRNVAAMRVVQPHGPYVIAGFSYGGVVAFEMACRLRSEGVEVARLVILDTNAPGREPSLGHRARTRTRTLQEAAPNSARWRSAVVARRAARFAATSGYAHAKRRVAFASAGWLPRRGNRQYQLFEQLNIHMSRHYTPSSTFDGPALVVRGNAFEGAPPRNGGSPTRPWHPLPDLGWSQLVRGPITAVEVPVDHLSLLRKPAVEVVAAHIAAALDDVARRRPG